MSRKNGFQKTCKNCNQQYYVQAYRAEASNFCSMACVWVGRPRQSKTEIRSTCHHCGKEYFVMGYRKEKTRFCSRKCTSIACFAKREPARLAALEAKKLPDTPERREFLRQLKAQNDRLRYARRKGAEGRHTNADVEKIRSVQKDRCANCRNKLHGKGAVDHIIPLTRGGSNWPRNLQLLCKSCNSSKNDRDPIDFAQLNGRLL